jgi:aquaporin Z
MIPPRLLTEFLGTLLLVTFIATAVANAGPLAPVAIGIGLMVLVYMGGHISGAQYNPAVAIAVWIRGGQDGRRTIAYIMAQIAGGLAGALIGSWLTGKPLMVQPAATAPLASVLLAEFVGTFALVLVILNVATHPATKGNPYYGAAIGGTVLACAATLGPISGGAFNPAVGVCPAIVNILTGQGVTLLASWIYIVGPVAGAIAAALIFRVQLAGTSEKPGA